MSGFDLVLRNGTCATASDTFRADIGIRNGRIAAIGEALDRGAREIDATDRLILPGGVDSHCHLDFPDFNDERPEVIARALDAGVRRMVTICTSD